LIDGDKRPDEGYQYQNNIDRSEEIIAESELKIGKRKIKNQIQDKRESNNPR